jgi:hypothetical protein
MQGDARQEADVQINTITNLFPKETNPNILNFELKLSVPANEPKRAMF